MTTRTRAFAVIAGLCVAALIAVVALAAAGGGSSRVAELPTRTDASVPSTPPPALAPGTTTIVRAFDARQPRLNGRLYRVTAAGTSTKIPGAPSCERIAVGGDHGICLYLARTGVDYRAALLDRDFHVTKVLGLPGLPSRARVSPDGRWAGITTFTYGDSYASPGTFSTRTQIIDLQNASVLADLEQWRFTLGGRPVNAVDRNFWGLSFGSDDDRFYATMATGRHHYLVQGSIRSHGGSVLRDDVECPSLSPDETRVAYKRTLGGGRWRLSVYDVQTRKDVALAETRSIDDQPSWLDDDHVAYSDGRATYVVPADGSGSPRLLVRGADSPTLLAAARSAPASAATPAA